MNQTINVMKAIKFLFILLISTGVLIWVGCDKDESPTSPANMTVKMTDAPAEFEAVYVEIEAVQVHYEDDENHPGADEDGWVFLETNAGLYNLLDLQNGVTVVLSDDVEIPAGQMTQMRLILGDDNHVIVAGIAIDLKTPSAQNSGLKININQNLEPNEEYEVVLDFDAEQSIVIQGDGDYLLKPVIKVESVIEL